MLRNGKTAMKATEIYSKAYTSAYDELYIRHPSLASRNRFNVAAIGALLPPLGTWLDTCCGQGWHLARFPHNRRMGLDISAAQLECARRENPGVRFIEADVLSYEFPDEQRFDLVTNLWSAYSYQDDAAAVETLVRKLIGWTAPGGALYMEMTDPRDVLTYPDQDILAITGASVTLLSPDGVRWEYRDAGGVHEMISPSLEFFTDLIAPHFAEVDAATVVMPLRQLIARGKKAG